jgi:phospholipid/cholesterol/gamma-HCH transport system substrate-binding protein
MMVAIRKSLRDFIAVAMIVVIAGVTSYIILQEQRLRIPILEEKPFQLQGEFETAQGVVAGQGQTLRVAGVRIGDVAEVELVDGRAIVTFDIDPEYLPIYKDAKVLLRPRTGLKDMEFHIDPGTRTAGEYEEGDMIPLANTAPDINLDEVLAAVDTDNQAYLRSILVGAGKGLEGRDKDLGRVLSSLGPINRDLKQLNSEVAKRDDNLKRLIHNLGVLTKAVGDQDQDIVRLVGTSNDTLSAIASEDPDIQEATRLLPGALRQTREALAAAGDFGDELGPAFDSLRPFVRNLPELNSSTTELAQTVTPVIRDQIRPFVRAARDPIPDLNTAARRYSRTAPKLTTTAKKLNRLGNMAAFNPRGAEPAGTAGRDEGYLYWAAWLAHNSTSVFASQDGNGLYRRIYFTASCQNIANLIAGEAGGGDPVSNLIRGAITGLTPVFAPGAVCG